MFVLQCHLYSQQAEARSICHWSAGVGVPVIVCKRLLRKDRVPGKIRGVINIHFN